MARVDGSETDSGAGGSGGGSIGPESVDIGSHIDQAIDASRSGGSDSGSGKRVRRTRAQLEADGYYAGTDSKAPSRPSVATAKKGSLDVNSIQFALTGIHALLAVAMSAPELELEASESETVAKNIVAVGRHYDLQQTAKATDWGNLIVSLGVVYGGRFMRIGIRRKAENKGKARDVKPGTGFVPTPPNRAPGQPQTQAPPNGINGSRPKTTDDLRLLDEIEAFVSP